MPELAELAEPYHTTNPIPIEDVEPDIFDTMLKHVYGKDIDVPYYGFTELKSIAEAC